MPSYRQNPDVAWRTLDGEAVLVRPREAMMLILNPVGTVIWEACENPATVTELSARVQREFDVNGEVADRDTREFVRLLVERACLVASSP